MERPERNLVAVTVVTLGVEFLPFFFFLQAASFYLFIYFCYHLHFFKIGG